MNNYVAPGHTLTLTAPSPGVVAGSLYKIGQIVGVAAVTANTGDPFAMVIEGIFTLPKVSNEPWQEGLLVYYQAGASGLLTSVSSNQLLVGFCIENLNVIPTNTAKVRFNGNGRLAGWS